MYYTFNTMPLIFCYSAIILIFFENVNEHGRNAHHILLQSRLYRPLFLSYEFVKRFLAITHLFFKISSWNLHDMRQHIFMILFDENSIGYDIFFNPMDPPIVKITHF